MKQQNIILCLLVLLGHTLFAQQRDIIFYQTVARENDPTIKQNKNLQNILGLQNNLINIQNKKPVVNFTSDVMFTPLFFNNGKAISFSDPVNNSVVGYDAAVSSRTVYTAQFNVAKNLLNKKIINAGLEQNYALHETYELTNRQLLHDIDKNVSDQYINIYLVQMQLDYLQSIILKIQERKNVVEQLVKKGLMAESDFLQLRILQKTEENNAELLRIQLIEGFGRLNLACNIKDTLLYTFIKPDLSLTLPVKEFHLQQKFLSDSTNIFWQQKVNNTKYLPQLSVYGNTGINSANINTIYRNIGMSAGLHFTVPIYDGHQRDVTEEQSKIQIENLKVERDYTAMQIESYLQNVLQQIKATQKSITLINDQLASHETLLNMLKEQIVLGQISVTDYIVSLQDYIATYQNKSVAQTNLLLLINQYNYINW